MEWFKHDTGATQDAKIKKLLIRHGAIGYAVYFHCLELIASDISVTNVTFQLEHDSEIIADNLKIKGTADKSGVEIVEEIMKSLIDLGLFQVSNGFIYGYKLLKRLDSSMSGNPRMRQLILEAKEHHDTIMTQSCHSHDTIMTESCKIRLEENRIDKNRLEDRNESDSYESEQPQKQPTKVSRFTKPTLAQVKEFCTARQSRIDPERFLDYYEANGWKIGKNPMKDWQAAVRTWERNEQQTPLKIPQSFEDQAALRRQAAYEQGMREAGLEP